MDSESFAFPSPFVVNMKVFCWNVRGLNSLSRQRCIRSWVIKNKPIFGSVLETHVSEENASEVLQATFPGWRGEMNYEASDLGRIWVIWDPSVSVICFHKSAQIMLCGVFVPGSGESFSVAFVYGFNTVVPRRSLWDDISNIVRMSPARNHPLLIMGDFNQILSANEHFSILPHPLPLLGMSDLMNCLVDNELSDLHSRGAFFTWSNHRPEDPVIRKLDRAVVNQHWSDRFPEALAIFDPPGDSDHAPCLVSTASVVSTGKKCFKYFSFLSTHPKFKEVIGNAWREEVCVGSQLFTIGQRLRKVKASCRELNRSGFGNIQQKTKDALAHLESVQSSLLTNPSESLFRQEFVARQRWNFFSKAQESFYMQKSRVRWMKDGDANTAYFHKAVVANQGKNCIKYLRGDDDERIDNSEQIKGMLVSFYQNLLGSENTEVEPFSIGEIRELVQFRCLPGLADQLLKIPSVEDIKSSIASMPKNKAPGPDGFPVEFFLEAWEVVGQDTIRAVQDFFVTGHLPRNFNATAITLIPKITGADKLNLFRPVSCCTTIYKIIARLLKQKLKLFISDAVQGNQVGFVQGRQLCENVLLASELVNNFHSSGEITRGCLQVDLAKAYDNLSWKFLENVLEAIDLPPQFVGWLKQCFTTPTFSVAFNGELLGFFPGKKGLRQGDPISSLLFVLAMDVLSKKLDKGAIDQRFGLHPACNVPLITHLSFADDVLIFFDGREESLNGILDILQEFKIASGLGISLSKSALFLDGGDVNNSQMVSSRTGIQVGSLPVRYLGVPLTTKKLSRQDYQPLLDKILARFNAWTAKFLSYAGRLQLIKSVIYSIITFWASIFVLPNQCLLDIEQMCNAFLWRGAPNSARGAKISWESVCSPKDSGGLGLRRLLPWNKVLGLKLIWLIFTSSGSLWVSWVRHHLIGNLCFWDLDRPTAGSWIWKSLCKLRLLARPFLVCEVSSGISCKFWTDDWTGLGPLLDIAGDNGPRVTGLPRNASVSDAIQDNEWWITRSRSRNSIIQLIKVCLPSPSVVNTDPLADDDCFLWKIGDSQASNVFSASKTWRHLNPTGPKVGWYDAIWFKGRIPKHAFISWVNVRHRLHTRDRLIRWGLNVPSTCLLCNSFDESRQHLFFDCPFAANIWSFFTSKAQVTPHSIFDDLVIWLKSPCRDKNIATILRIAFQASVYVIWKERNSRLHLASSRTSAALLVDLTNLIRCRLDPLSREQRVTPPNVTILAAWFGTFQL